MRINYKNENIIVEDVEDFVLSQTLECGQCFRYDKIGDNDYIIVAMNKMLHIKQEEQTLTLYNTTEDDYKNIWEDYFDLKTDYGAIKKILLEKDDKIKDAIDTQGGIRILNQEFDEVLMSFIISQNQQIPRIRKIISEICERYGDEAGTFNGKTYYTFPDKMKLAEITEEEYRECKTGFRASYLYGAAQMLKDSSINGEELKNLDRDEAEQKLTGIRGVGKKVADCTLLFGLGFKAAFPIDVWIKRIMEELYFGKEVKKEVIQEYAAKCFGEWGGYAQQYLFAYARENKSKNKKMEEN